MKKNHSKHHAALPTSRRVVEPKTDAVKSAPQPKHPWKPIRLEDLNLTIEQMEVFAEVCRYRFGPPTSEEDDEEQEPEESQTANVQDRRATQL